MASGWVIGSMPLPPLSICGDTITVFDHYGLSFTVIDPLDRAAGAAGDGNLIEAPMPGLVKAVFAEAGAAVKEGDRLAILEAMKMEHSIRAAEAGEVTAIHCAEGDLVEEGRVLVALQPLAEEATA